MKIFRTFVLLSFLLAACGGKDSRPNIILILADDQGYGDLGCHGNPWIKTPHLDQFSKNALECTNFHVGTTCSPTRAGIMTGRNANRNGAWHTIAGCSILNAEEETMAEVFAGAGYETAMFGKWHLGDNYPYRPNDRGFDEALYCGGGGVWQTPDYWTNDYFDDTYFRNGQPEKVQGYCTDVWFGEAIKYIERPRSRPFFLYLAPNAAHSPFNVPPEYMDLYKNTPLKPSQRRFYGMISNLDDNFGRLINYLKNSGLEKNTIIIYTTDNGTAAGIFRDRQTQDTIGYNAGLRGTKGSHYDGGHRVPFFIRWPGGGLQGGTKIEELIAHVDVLPTLAEMSGLSYTPKQKQDGTGMLSALKGNVSNPGRMLVIDTQRRQWPEKGRNSCVMSTEWRLVNGDELYNFYDDPGQKNNVAGLYPEQVKKMQQFYDEWWAGTVAEWKHSPIPIGNENGDPVLITVHDWHTDQGLPWNQQMIRKATHNPEGYYSVEVKNPGSYNFQLSRYPPESGLAINASAAPMPGSEFKDGFVAGKAINARYAIVETGSTVVTEPVDANKPFTAITAELDAGQMALKTWFELEDGNRIPAYYNLITKVK